MTAVGQPPVFDAGVGAAGLGAEERADDASRGAASEAAGAVVSVVSIAPTACRFAATSVDVAGQVSDMPREKNNESTVVGVLEQTKL